MVLIFKASKERLTLADVHNVVNGKNIQIGIYGGQLAMHAFAFLMQLAGLLCQKCFFIFLARSPLSLLN